MDLKFKGTLKDLVAFLATINVADYADLQVEFRAVKNTPANDMEEKVLQFFQNRDPHFLDKEDYITEVRLAIRTTHLYSNDPVAGIKTMRATHSMGLGLKDAKDLYELISGTSIEEVMAGKPGWSKVSHA